MSYTISIKDTNSPEVFYFEVVKLTWNKTLDDQIPELNQVPKGLCKSKQVILRGWWCSSGQRGNWVCCPQLWGLGLALLDLSPPPEVWPIYPYLHQLRHKRLPVQTRVLELKATLLLVRPQATCTMEEQQAQTRDSRMICAFSKLCSEGLSVSHQVHSCGTYQASKLKPLHFKVPSFYL